MHRVHYFASSAQAYEASLDAGPVREGDILVIDAERIVGLASTDPIAITTESGALKAFAPMDRESLLAELVHDAAAIGRAVDEALRHRLPVADHFLGFAGPSHVVLPSELHRTLTREDIMVTTDAIDHRIAALRGRTQAAAPDSSEGLFLRKALDQLAGARGRLSGDPRQTG